MEPEHNARLRADMERYVDALRKFGAKRPEGFVYENLQHFVLENGEAFDHVSPHADRYMQRPPGVCFYNSRVAASKSKGKLVYVEGFAYSALATIAIHHAWNIDQDGGVVETTWREPGVAYIGVRLPIDYVRRMATPQNNSILDQWEKDWPLFKQKFDPSTLIEGVGV